MTLQTFGIIRTSFQGVLIDQNDPTNNLPRAISVPGLKAGDIILSVHFSSGNSGEQRGGFPEQPIQTDDQITQQGGDLSAFTYDITVLRLG